MDKKVTKDWSPDSWCVATLEVSHAVAGRLPGVPAFWLVMLWEPSFRALPFREPTTVCLIKGDPWPQIVEDCDGAPIYELLEEECDWATWLDMVLQLEGIADWEAAMLRRQMAAKRDAKMLRWRESYGADEDSEDEKSEFRLERGRDVAPREHDFGDSGLSEDRRSSDSELPSGKGLGDEGSDPR